jgi:ABC-type Mn2+/Zn2+ transport system ATPase subunit
MALTAGVVVQLAHVEVRFQDLLVLEDVSLSVPSGAFWAVLGPNGAGKTTLLRAILGLVRPTVGMVRVFGQPPWELTAERRRIGYVPQAPSVDVNFPVRAGDVVLMGRYGRIGLFRRPAAEDRAAARQALDRVGMADLADRPLARLSGGQRQRVFLARALANEPDLLLLDEPTTGVDVAATESLYELLDRLHAAGMTILVVSHDVGVVAAFVDGVACLNRRLVAHGRPEEVLGSEALEAMYGCAAAFFHHGRVPHIVVEREQ